MKIYRSFDEIIYDKKTVLTVGTFDGVHLGHQKIIKNLLENAKINNWRALLLTIDPHPQIVLQKEGKKPVKLLTMIDERLKLFEKFGLEHVLIIPFTFEFSRTSPEIFVSEYLSAKAGMIKILIGWDHMFGKDREGNESLLQDLGQSLDFQIEKIEALVTGDINVSSSKIRNNIENHRIEDANDMLGYKYFVNGKIIKGDGRGRKLGIPTANFLIPEHKLLPGNGVYLVRSVIDGEKYFGMANIGTRPMFTNDIVPILEVNYLDFDMDIYHREIEVEFLNFIRFEEKFANLEIFLKELENDRRISRELIKKFYN